MIEIRPIEARDEPVWRQMWTAYLVFYGATVEEGVYASSFARLISDGPNEFCGQIAFLDGKAIGLVHYLFHRHGWKIENVVYLQDLYVTDDARGTGAGRALMEAVYNAADVAGSPNVYWLTQDFNETARKLYDRVGDVTPFIKYQRRIS